MEPKGDLSQAKNSLQFDDLTNKHIFRTAFKEDRTAVSVRRLEASRLSNQDGTLQSTNAQNNAAVLSAWNNAWQKELKDDSLTHEEREDIGTGLGQSHRARLNEDLKGQNRGDSHLKIKFPASNPIGVKLRGDARALELAREIQSSVTKSKAPVVRKRVVKGSNLQAHPPPPVVESPVRRPTKGSATKAFSVSAPHHPAPKIVPQNLAAITESFRRQQRSYPRMELAPPAAFLAATALRRPRSSAASTASSAIAPDKEKPQPKIPRQESQVESTPEPSITATGLHDLSVDYRATSTGDAQSNTPTVRLPIETPTQTQALLKSYLPQLKQLLPVDFFAQLETFANVPAVSEAHALRVTTDMKPSTNGLPLPENQSVESGSVREDIANRADLLPVANHALSQEIPTLDSLTKPSLDLEDSIKNSQLSDNAIEPPNGQREDGLKQKVTENKAGQMVCQISNCLKAFETMQNWRKHAEKKHAAIDINIREASKGAQDVSKSQATTLVDIVDVNEHSAERSAAPKTPGNIVTTSSVPLLQESSIPASKVSNGVQPSNLIDLERAFTTSTTPSAAEPLQEVSSEHGHAIRGSRKMPSSPEFRAASSTRRSSHREDSVGVPYKLVYPREPEPEMLKAATIISENRTHDIRLLVAKSLLRQREAIVGDRDLDASESDNESQPLNLSNPVISGPNFSLTASEGAGPSGQGSLAERLNAQREAIAGGVQWTDKHAFQPKFRRTSLSELQAPYRSIDNARKRSDIKTSLPRWLEQQLDANAALPQRQDKNAVDPPSSQGLLATSIHVPSPGNTRLSSSSGPALGAADARGNENQGKPQQKLSQLRGGSPSYQRHKGDLSDSSTPRNEVTRRDREPTSTPPVPSPDKGATATSRDQQAQPIRLDSQPPLGAADARGRENSATQSLLAAQITLNNDNMRAKEPVSRPSQATPPSRRPPTNDQPRKENKRPKPTLPAWLVAGRTS